MRDRERVLGVFGFGGVLELERRIRPGPIIETGLFNKKDFGLFKELSILYPF